MSLNPQSQKARRHHLEVSANVLKDSRHFSFRQTGGSPIGLRLLGGIQGPQGTEKHDPSQLVSASAIAWTSAGDKARRLGFVLSRMAGMPLMAAWICTALRPRLVETASAP